MKSLAKIATAIACLAMLGNIEQAQAQSGNKGGSNKKMAEKTMAAKPTSRAFTNGYNVPSNGVAIEGYCPVCYFAANKAVKGTPQFSHDYNGITYWFVNENARQAFIADPEKFIPAYGGWCAVGVSMGQRFPVDPERFKIVNGRLMLFLKNAKVDAIELWNRDEAGNLNKAEQNWKRLGS